MSPTDAWSRVSNQLPQHCRHVSFSINHSFLESQDLSSIHECIPCLMMYISDIQSGLVGSGWNFPPAGMAASASTAGGLGLAGAVLCASKWREASSRFSVPDEDDAWDFDACCDQQAEAEPCNEDDFGYDTCGFEDGEEEVLSTFAQSSAVHLPLLETPSSGSSQVCGQKYLCNSTHSCLPIHFYKHFS